MNKKLQLSLSLCIYIMSRDGNKRPTWVIGSTTGQVKSDQIFLLNRKSLDFFKSLFSLKGRTTRY